MNTAADKDNILAPFTTKDRYRALPKALAMANTGKGGCPHTGDSLLALNQRIFYFAV